MRKFLHILIIFVSFTSYAQKDYATEVFYKVNLNRDVSISYVSKLAFNNSISYYTEGNEEINIDEHADKKIKTYGSEFNKTYKVDLKSELIFTKDNLNGTIILAKEKRTQIPWEIEEKSKDSILGFACKKATGKFRGRVYTVWFTEEIPARFGPWKLNGLPGLILEAKDNLNEVEFIVEKIKKLKKSKPFKDNFPGNDPEYKIITLKEYTDKQAKDVDSKIQALLSKMPRGSNIIGLKKKKYKGLELQYDWE